MRNLLLGDVCGAAIESQFSWIASLDGLGTSSAPLGKLPSAPLGAGETSFAALGLG